MDTPGLIYGAQTDYKNLFASPPDQALTLDVFISRGFGVLKSGTVIARNTSAAGNGGKYVPYDPHATISAAAIAPGRAYLVTDCAGSTTGEILIEDSWKFIIGDEVFHQDSDTALATAGVISAIDRITYLNKATVTTNGTWSTSVDAGSMFGNCYAKGGDIAIGILMQSVDTGIGENAKGANATLIMHHAKLYVGMLLNLDTNAKSDLGMASRDAIGQFIYLP